MIAGLATCVVLTAVGLTWIARGAWDHCREATRHPILGRGCAATDAGARVATDDFPISYSEYECVVYSF
jgi:hypothetical protein